MGFPHGGRLSNFQARLITGIVSALVTLAVTWQGGRVFAVFCLCVGAAALYEWNAIVRRCAGRLSLCCAWLFYALFALALAAAPPSAPGQAAVFAALGLGFAAVYAASLLRRGPAAALWQAGGLLYAALFPLSLACLRAGGILGAGGALAGLYWTLLLYIIVWASDVGAYVFGRSFRGPKLAPKISPNKTWSGAGGGLLCAALAALCFVYCAEAWFFSANASAALARRGVFSPQAGIFAALLLSLVSQAGDLLESWFKRRFGVKDSGRLLPGHGGVMDRIDGLLPACAVFVVFLGLFCR